MKHKLDEILLPIPGSILHTEAEQRSHELRYGAPEPYKEKIQTSQPYVKPGSRQTFPSDTHRYQNRDPKAPEPQQKPKFASTVIDSEIAQIVRRFIRKFDVSDETLAVKEIASVVETGKMFLGSRHSLEHLTEEHDFPTLSCRFAWPEWKKRGAKEVCDRAKEIARETLKKHIPEPLDNDTQKQLDGIMHLAKRELIR